MLGHNLMTKQYTGGLDENETEALSGTASMF